MSRLDDDRGAADAPAELIRAAGGVLWRPGDAGDPSIALIHRPHRDDWSLPKGKLDPGEAEPEAALREIEEETGLRARLGRGLGIVRYMDARSAPPRPKVVRYWAAELVEGEFHPRAEVDDLRWATDEEARSLLTYDRDREVIGRFAAGPPRVATLLLVRHADAVDSYSWSAGDPVRPLRPSGRARAERLARMLRGFNVQLIVSSSAARCSQTVEPLARAVGLAVVVDEALTERGHAEDPAAAALRVRRLGIEGSAVVVCTHAPVLTDLLRRLGVSTESAQAAQAAQGGTWALSLAGDELVAAEYLAAPVP